MCNSRRAAALGAAAVLCVMATTALVAQNRLPLLPQPHVFAQTGDSPGKVTFNHASHVSDSAPGCTACHPRLFKILTSGTAANGKAITHDAMKQGRACGACHDGKKSFGVDDCSMCHRS
ncbi:MAG: c(7)-type cytochrome triheme domain-containing protein [Acidobacteriota bacterium]